MDTKAIITKRKIEALAAQYEISDSVIRAIFNQNQEYFDVFVSHSSSDNVFIKKILTFLHYAKGGVNGYVDWQDPEMPSITNAETAKQLKKRIERARKLIYVVTNDSLKSVWCSWEIGYADKSKGIDNMAILAIKPNNGRWKHNEYLQQYPWIEYNTKTQLFQVHLIPDGIMTLSDWLTM